MPVGEVILDHSPRHLFAFDSSGAVLSHVRALRALNLFWYFPALVVFRQVDDATCLVLLQLFHKHPKRKGSFG